jgi:hypothetical protein
VTELVRPTHLLDQLALNGAFQHGLNLPPDIPYEQLESVGFMLGQHYTDVRMAMGDYLVTVENRFPEKFSQAIEALGMSEGGAMDYARVCRQVPKSVRRPDVPSISFSHYRCVASMKVVDSKTGEITTDHKAQKEWLSRAAENQWSHHKFRAELKPAPDEPEPSPSICRCCGQPTP